MRKRITELLKRCYPTVAGAFILMIFALYNGYPLFSNDSASYIHSGYYLQVAGDRPVFYGLFIRATSLGISMWGTVLAQCLILSYLCMRFIKSLAPGIDGIRVLGVMSLLPLGTIAGWYAGMVMPDVFAPMLFLSMYLYLVQQPEGWQRAWTLGLVLLSVLVHYSHFMISVLVLFVVLLLSFIDRAKWGYVRGRAVQLLGVSIAALLMLYTSNYIGGHGFRSGSASHVFLMGKMAENGMLKKYLDDTCPTKGYKICAYKDSLPKAAWEFVWDQPSPVYREGGWEATRQEYDAILNDMVTSPKYWPLLVGKSVNATFRQVVLTNIDEGEERSWVKFEEGHPVFELVKKIFPQEVQEFAISKQNAKNLNIVLYDRVYVIVMVLSSILVLLGLPKHRRPQAGMVYGLLILFLFANAFVTASFANIISRLNSRAIWLLPLTNMAYIYLIVKDYTRRSKNAM
jgi:hypothetical protein